MDNYVDMVLKKIEEELKVQNMTIAKLSEETKICSSTLSKIINKKTKLSLEHLFRICRALKIEPSKMLEVKNENKQDFGVETGLFHSNKFKNQDTLIRDPKNTAFNGYLGQEFYVYFYSTISSEVSLICGKLKFDASKEATYCKATFELNTGKKDKNGQEICKKYEGELLISLSMSCCYCILMNSLIGEFCFLNFRHMFLFNQTLVCRVAAALTTSSGESKLPTIHRALLSYRQLYFTDDNDSDLDYIQAQLRLNNSNIIISKECFEEKVNKIIERPSISDNVKQIIKNVISDQFVSEYYVIDEAKIRGEIYSDAEKIKAINILRDLSVSSKYNKISPKSDEFFFKYLSDSE